MAITKAIKQLLQESKDKVPERVTAKGSNALRLKLTNGKQIMLINKDGKTTEYGRHWYDEVKKEAAPSTGFDPETRMVRKFRTDYITTKNGRQQPGTGHK